MDEGVGISYSYALAAMNGNIYSGGYTKGNFALVGITNSADEFVRATHPRLRVPLYGGILLVPPHYFANEICNQSFVSCSDFYSAIQRSHMSILFYRAVI